MSTKTTFKGIEASDRNWHLVDASNLPVGRLASEIAQILKGKHVASILSKVSNIHYIISGLYLPENSNIPFREVISN